MDKSGMQRFRVWEPIGSKVINMWLDLASRVAMRPDRRKDMWPNQYYNDNAHSVDKAEHLKI